MRRRASALMLPAVIGGTMFFTFPTTAAAHGGNNDPSLVHACLGLHGYARLVPANQECLRIEVPVHWSTVTSHLESASRSAAAVMRGMSCSRGALCLFVMPMREK